MKGRRKNVARKIAPKPQEMQTRIGSKEDIQGRPIGIKQVAERGKKNRRMREKKGYLFESS
jgi:hypothetical protein